MENLLSKGTVKDIDVIISENDNMIFGAMKALDRNGKSYGPEGDIIMISFDALHESFENMMAGKLHATVECNPLFGIHCGDGHRRTGSRQRGGQDL